MRLHIGDLAYQPVHTDGALHRRFRPRGYPHAMAAIERRHESQTIGIRHEMQYRPLI
jgi:hypothetical protein